MSMPRLTFSDMAPSSVGPEGESSLKKEARGELADQQRMSPKQALIKQKVDNDSRLKVKQSGSIMKLRK